MGGSFRLFLTPTHFPYCHVCKCSAAASGAPSTPSEEIVVFEPGEEVEEEVNQIEAQHLVDEDMVVDEEQKKGSQNFEARTKYNIAGFKRLL